MGTDPKEVLQCLLEHIDIKQIPPFYGGELRCGDGSLECARLSSDEELSILEHVRLLDTGATPLKRGAKK